MDDGSFASAVLSSALDCVIVIDHEGRILEFNRAAERTFAYKRATVLGGDISELIIPPSYRQRHRDAFKACLEHGDGRLLGRRLELVGMRSDGTEFPVELTVTQIRGAEPPAFAGYIRDITGQKPADQRLSQALERERTARASAASQSARAKRLMAQVLASEEYARRRLAQALHDGPLQDVASAHLALSMVPGLDHELLTDVMESLRRSMDQLRGAVFDLYPPAVDHLGLEQALIDLTAEMSRRSGLKIDLHVGEGVSGPHDQLLFSLTRELLSNAERHARASMVSVRMVRMPTELRLTIQDDGIGVSKDRIETAVREGHIGLASSVERVEALGGRFSLEPGGGKGTRVEIVLPARREIDRPRVSNGAPEPPERSRPIVQRERRTLRV